MLENSIEFHEYINEDGVLPSKLFEHSMSLKWLEGCKYLLKRGIDVSEVRHMHIVYGFADLELIKLLNLKPEKERPVHKRF